MSEDREEVGDFDDVPVRKLKLIDDDDDDAQELSAALNAVKAKLAADPNNADLHAELGQIYQNLEQDDEAEESFEKAIQLNPNKISFYQQKASVYVATSQYEEAQAVLNKALSLEPNNADILYELGRTYLLDEEHKQAQDYFQQAVAKNPHHAASLFQLALYAQESKNSDRALELFRQVIAVDKSNMQAYSSAGQILQDKKSPAEIKEAATCFAQAVTLSPSDVQLRAKLIQCYDAIGAEAEREQARADLHAAFANGQLNPSYKVRPRYCCSQIEVGDKFVMGFDHSKPEGQHQIKYAFNAYKKGEIHEDKVLFRVTLEVDAGKYNLVLSKPERTVQATFDSEPSFQVVKEQAIQIISA